MKNLTANSTLKDVEKLYHSIDIETHYMNADKEKVHVMLQYVDIPYCKELGTVLRTIVSCKRGIPREAYPITIQEAMESIALGKYFIY